MLQRLVTYLVEICGALYEESLGKQRYCSSFLIHYFRQQICFHRQGPFNPPPDLLRTCRLQQAAGTPERIVSRSLLGHPTMLMLAAMVAGAERSSSDLGTSAAELAAASTSRWIGVSRTNFWSAMPQPFKEMTVEVGTKLVFTWNGGHDVVIATKDAWDSCVCTGLSNDESMRYTHLAPHYIVAHTRRVLNIIRALDRASRPAKTTSAWPLSPRRLIPVTGPSK